MDAQYPAPWKLTGKGYILIYHFNQSFVENQGRVPSFLRNQYAGGLGSVMLVDYTVSDAGPYQELLFIPGKFYHLGKKLNTISKIYVSTMESVVNGRKNWAIPKELASFTFENQGEEREHVRILAEDQLIADFTFKTGKLAFPVNTRFLPFPLVQEQNGQYFYTTFSGTGQGRFAKIESVQVNPELFPDISLCKPLAVIKVEPFAITFPVPRIVQR